MRFHVVDTDTQVEAENAMAEVEADKPEELAVVVLSDAIVQPKAVMIKATDTFVAGSAVLGGGVRPFKADSTAVDFLGGGHSGSVQAAVLFTLLLLLLLISKLLESGDLIRGLVTGVALSDIVGKLDNCQGHHQVKHDDDRQSNLRLMQACL